MVSKNSVLAAEFLLNLRLLLDDVEPSLSKRH